MFVCPICRSRTITVYGENSTAKCDACGTFDALHKFEAAIIQTNPGERVPEAIFPPDEIVECVNKLRDYFVRDRGAKQWAFGHVQSRDEPALIGIEHVRNMAAAFRMQLVVPPTEDSLTSDVQTWIAQGTNVWKELAPNQPEPVREYVAHYIAKKLLAGLFAQ